jgi:DNA-binding HxlR family transcriptional regulator
MRNSPTFLETRIAACLAEHRSLSFTGLQLATDTKSDQKLSRTLARMRRNGRIVRHVHATTPPTTSYRSPDDGNPNDMK